MSDPLVSILIPVYNRADIIALTLQSAMAQRYPNIEIVVVDNCSTDRTYDLVQYYASRDSRIRFFRNESNIGPIRNWQRCCAEARGEYGKVLFSDDLIHSDFLAATVPYLSDLKVGFAFTTVEVGLEPGRGSLYYEWTQQPECATSSAFIHDAMFGDGTPVSPGAALFRLSDLRANLKLSLPLPTFSECFESGIGPDLLLLLLTARAYPFVVHLSQPLAFFRKHDGSITMSSRTAHVWDCYAQAKIWFALEHGSTAMLKRILSGAWSAACLNEGRWFNPAVYFRQFVGDRKVPGPRWQSLVWVLWGLAKAKNARSA